MKLRGYEIKECIGEGGTARVFRAHQISLDRDVAIKILRRAFENNACIREGFIESGRLAAKVSSPHSVTVYEIGFEEEGIIVSLGGSNNCRDNIPENRRDEEGHFFIAMEMLPSSTLATMLDGLNLEEALDAFEQVCKGLEAAHRAGVVHGDLKPGNILFRESGEAVVSDYAGSACLAEVSSPVSLASPAYMSPEQVRGDPPSEQSDIYSLGIMLYEILSGMPPFTGDSALATARAQLHATPERLDDETKPFSVILNKMLHKDPAARYSSVSALRRELSLLRMALSEPDSSRTQLMPGLHEDDEEFLARLLDGEIQSLQHESPAGDGGRGSSSNPAQPVHSDKGAQAEFPQDNHLHDTQEIEPQKITPQDTAFTHDFSHDAPLDDFDPPTVEEDKPVSLSGSESQEAEVIDLTEALDMAVVDLDAPPAPAAPEGDERQGLDITHSTLKLGSFPRYTDSTQSISLENGVETQSSRGDSWKSGLVWALTASVLTSVVILGFRGLHLRSEIELAGKDSARENAEMERGERVEQDLSLPLETAVVNTHQSTRQALPNDSGIQPPLVQIPATEATAEKRVIVPSRFDTSPTQTQAASSATYSHNSALPGMEAASAPTQVLAEQVLRDKIAALPDPAIEVRDGRLRINEDIEHSLKGQGLDPIRNEEGRLAIMIDAPEGTFYQGGMESLDDDTLTSLRKLAYVLRNFSGIEILLADHRGLEPAVARRNTRALKRFFVSEGIAATHLKSAAGQETTDSTGITITLRPDSQLLSEGHN